MKNPLNILGPKTYLPLAVIIVTAGLEALGVTVDETVKESIYTIGAALAAWFIRQGMVKENDITAEVDKRVDEKLNKIIKENTQSILKQQ